MREHKTLKQIYIRQFYLAILYLKKKKRKDIEDRYCCNIWFWIGP